MEHLDVERKNKVDKKLILEDADYALLQQIRESVKSLTAAIKSLAIKL